MKYRIVVYPIEGVFSHWHWDVECKESKEDDWRAVWLGDQDGGGRAGGNTRTYESAVRKARHLALDLQMAADARSESADRQKQNTFIEEMPQHFLRTPDQQSAALVHE